MEDINILIISSNKYYSDTVTYVLSKITKKLTVTQALDKAINIITSGDVFDFIVTDSSFFNKNFTLKNFVDFFPELDLIIVASNSTYSDGSHSLQSGAKEYIDFNKEVASLPRMILNIMTEKKEKTKLKENLLKDYSLASNNESYNKMLLHCEKVARSKVNILLTGESGTGKEVAARYIHLCSSRSSSNFIAVNCSSYTETLLESELFGHEQGAFTGATKSKEGRFEFSNNGTLFLDEVGDINLTTQVKLLRVLETKKVGRLGSNVEKFIDFRLVSATNKDLLEEVVNKTFREDFFYRISSIVINVPPLKERTEDLEYLINYFLEKSQEENNIKINGMEQEPKDFLYSYEYPGNIRELKSIIDRMVVLSTDGIITKDGIPILYNIKRKASQLLKNNINGEEYNKIVTLKEFKSESESRYIQWVLEQTGGNVAEASRKLDMSSRQLFNKIREYDIKK